MLRHKRFENKNANQSDNIQYNFISDMQYFRVKHFCELQLPMFMNAGKDKTQTMKGDTVADIAIGKELIDEFYKHSSHYKAWKDQK